MNNRTMVCIHDELYRAITSISYIYRLVSKNMHVRIVEKYYKGKVKGIIIYDICLERKKEPNRIISSSLLTYNEIIVLDMLFNMLINTKDFEDKMFFDMPNEFYNKYEQELNSLKNTRLRIVVSHNRSSVGKEYISQMLVEIKEHSVSLGDFGNEILRRTRFLGMSNKYLDKKITTYSKYQLMKYITTMIFINREKREPVEISMVTLLRNTIIWDENGYNTRTSMLSLIQSKNANATNNYRNFVNALKKILKECEKDRYVDNIEVLCNGGLKGIENDKIIINFNKKCK